MYTLIENGVISEVICGDNFEYVLNNSSDFVATDFKVLQSQNSGIFVKFMKMTRNGKISLFYETSEYRSLASMIPELSADAFVDIIINLFASVIEVRNNGFLACQSIVLLWNKIFVERTTNQVKLVYLPVNTKAFGSYEEFEAELVHSVINLIEQSVQDKNGRIIQFLNDLQNPAIPFEEVYTRYKDQKTPFMNINYSPKPVTSAPTAPVSQSGGIKFVALNAPSYFEIVIDGDDIVIGKNPEMADKIIPYSNKISRKHCRVRRGNGYYYIKDEDSANGTFVNEKRLGPGDKVQIRHGDIVRLADSEFHIV